jgi:hypothetical protein
MAKITVGCKLPHGLHLDVKDNAGKTHRITLKGAHHANPAELQIPNGRGATFGITTGVDKDLFDRWMAEHKDFPAVKNGSIFAAESPERVKAEGGEKSKEVTGFEGLDPSKNNGGVETADEQSRSAFA